jgi:hypothetical protein
MGSPDQRRQLWLPWPRPALIFQASHNAFLVVEHHMAVDNPSVDAPPDDLVIAHLVVAVMEGLAKTGSCHVVGGEAGSWAT